MNSNRHGTEAELTRDEARAAELRRLGYRVFRARSIDVYENIERLLDALLEFIESEA
jgi:very-short-patch-repair endonuclease